MGSPGATLTVFIATCVAGEQRTHERERISRKMPWHYPPGTEFEMQTLPFDSTFDDRLTSVIKTKSENLTQKAVLKILNEVMLRKPELTRSQTNNLADKVRMLPDLDTKNTKTLQLKKAFFSHYLDITYSPTDSDQIYCI